MRDIDYKKMLENTEQMIEALEYDAQRSPGKTKFNAAELFYLYEMKTRCENKLKGAKAQDSTDTRKKAKAVAEG